MMADRKSVENLLKTARGQLDGILKMVEEDRYCMDISNQILSTQSILRKVNRLILEAHLSHCVKQTFEAQDQIDSQKKIDELMQMFDKISQ